MPLIRSRSVVRTAIAGFALVAASSLHGQGGADSTAATTTRSKVFTAVQAAKGREVHGAACLSCHKTVEFAGDKFWGGLVGKTLGEFFGYVRSSMPQDNPGSLADDDYASVVAFILQLNTMPAGDTPLPADSTALAKIRVVPPDSTRKGPGQ